MAAWKDSKFSFNQKNLSKVAKNRKHQVTLEEIAAFNQLRIQYVGREMSVHQLTEFLRQLGYATSRMFIRSMTEGSNPPIIKIRHGVYSVNPKPVFIDRLKTVWDSYNRKNMSRFDGSVEEAIELLKSHGYKIYIEIS